MDSPHARDAVLSGYAKSLIRHKARQLCRNLGFSSTDREDLEQELTMHLLTKAHLFDPGRASSSTFAERVIRTTIAMMLRDRSRQKRAAGFKALSLEGTDVVQGHGIASLRDLLRPSDLGRRTGMGDEERRAETVAAVNDALQSLPPDLQDLCSRLINGTTASAARDMGISRRQVRNAIERVRRHFEASGLGDS